MPRDIPALVAAMTLDEKASLTAGDGMWSTAAIDRLGIRPVRVTDGPNGARGAIAPGASGSPTSVCVPCGSALGATWDPSLLEAVGRLIGDERLEELLGLHERSRRYRAARDLRAR